MIVGYGHNTSNGAVKGYGLWGDLYSYGVGGLTGMIIIVQVVCWRNELVLLGSLGYKNSAINMAHIGPAVDQAAIVLLVVLWQE